MGRGLKSMRICYTKILSKNLSKNSFSKKTLQISSQKAFSNTNLLLVYSKTMYTFEIAIHCAI